MRTKFTIHVARPPFVHSFTLALGWKCTSFTNLSHHMAPRDLVPAWTAFADYSTSGLSCSSLRFLAQARHRALCIGRRWLCVFGGLCVDMWRLVHQWSFLLFDCFWRLVHGWYSLGKPVTTGTPMVIFAVFDDWYTVGTVLVGPWRWYTNGHFWYTVGRVLVNLWRLVHNGHFAVLTVFWLFLTIGRGLHC